MKRPEITYDNLIEAALTSGEKQKKVEQWLTCLTELKPLAQSIATIKDLHGKINELREMRTQLEALANTDASEHVNGIKKSIDEVMKLIGRACK